MAFKDLVCCLLSTATHCLGEDVFYEPCKGGSFKIRAIFDENFQQVDPETEEVVDSNTPVLGVKLKDIPFPPEQGDKVIVGRRKFRVTDSQEDGQGGASLVMHEERS